MYFEVNYLFFTTLSHQMRALPCVIMYQDGFTISQHLRNCDDRNMYSIVFFVLNEAIADVYINSKLIE